MRTRLAAEWEANGWEWDLQIGGLILDRVEAAGNVDAAAVAAQLPAAYLARYGTDREALAEAISRAIADETLDPEPKMTSTLVVNGDTYNLSIRLSDQARIDGSPFSVGPGTQINVDVDAPREDLLSALQALVAAGLSGNWDERAAADLGSAIEGREDLGVDDVKKAVLVAGETTGAGPSRIGALLERVALGALGSTLGAGLTAGLGLLLQNPPF